MTGTASNTAFVWRRWFRRRHQRHTAFTGGNFWRTYISSLSNSTRSGSSTFVRRRYPWRPFHCCKTIGVHLIVLSCPVFASTGFKQTRTSFLFQSWTRFFVQTARAIAPPDTLSPVLAQPSNDQRRRPRSYFIGSFLFQFHFCRH